MQNDAALLRLAQLELDVSDIRQQIAALVRLASLDHVQRTVERTDPRAVRAERAHRLLCELADACGPCTWSTAWCVRLVLTGEDPPPAGFHRIVALLRDYYQRPPAQATIWRAMSERRERLAAGLLS